MGLHHDGGWQILSILSALEISMITEVFATPSGFWDTVAEHVTAKVEPALRQGSRARRPVIAYLRDLEVVARRECDSRDVVQVIASGRRILGDRSEVGIRNGPFSRI